MAKAIRLLKPYEINVKVRTVSPTGKAVTLLYKDARTDMTLLDETFGTENWQTSYNMVGSVLYCTISVWSEESKQWISKQSNGTESDIDAEKGQASDALKRAGFLWGIGRELYTGPSILIDVKQDELNIKGNGLKPWINFHVAEIGYNEVRRCITKLVIKDNKGNTRFNWKSNDIKTSVTVTNDFESSVTDGSKPSDAEKTEAKPFLNFTAISEFTPKAAFAHISTIIGDVHAKDKFKELGATKPSEITEEIYLSALEYCREYINGV